ncbi:enoyl-CoA hydratase/isomerase family protein [Nocardioides alcanivorans]|uniref:enoyl-CoA hydratase/isomerase family protein n=1 Tax=Nocardioides alcanivorans TaxID=2897352 RepID=UPI001F30751A|nr:enoyl-CoA hydratase-related protein [Nocardioides alcanivorans]
MSVLAHVDGAIGLITLDRPEKRNALNTAMIDGLARALLGHEANPAVRAVVLTATGDRAFCAGMDLNRVADAPTDASAATTRRPEAEVYRRLLVEGSSKPLVAAVNGTAVAGGFELMLACDLVVAADRALFGLPEVSRGLVAGAGGTFLPLRVPRALAFEIALTGQLFDATRARAMGLVNEVVPADDVLPHALGLARTVAANSPNAVRLTRRLLRESTELRPTEAWSQVDAAVAEAMTSDDAREGASAFLERRAPCWS